MMESIQVITVFDPDPNSELALQDDGTMVITFENLPAGIDVSATYPAEALSAAHISGNALTVPINDAASGSSMLFYVLTFNFDSTKGGQLVPLSYEYCLPDPTTTTPFFDIVRIFVHIYYFFPNWPNADNLKNGVNDNHYNNDYYNYHYDNHYNCPNNNSGTVVTRLLARNIKPNMRRRGHKTSVSRF